MQADLCPLIASTSGMKLHLDLFAQPRIRGRRVDSPGPSLTFHRACLAELACLDPSRVTPVRPLHRYARSALEKVTLRCLTRVLPSQPEVALDMSFSLSPLLLGPAVS